MTCQQGLDSGLPEEGKLSMVRGLALADKGNDWRVIHTELRVGRKSRKHARLFDERVCNKNFNNNSLQSTNPWGFRVLTQSCSEEKLI